MTIYIYYTLIIYIFSFCLMSGFAFLAKEKADTQTSESSFPYY